MIELISIPLDLNSPKVDLLLKEIDSIDPPIKATLVENPRPFANCYWNALAYSESSGGEVMFGWMLTEWPGVLITAEHHAIVRNAAGEYLDVTSRYQTYPNSEPTIFSFDQNFEIDYDSAPNVKCVNIPLSNDSRVGKRISVYEEKHKHEGEKACLFKEMGVQVKKSQMNVAKGEPPEQMKIPAVYLEKYKQIELKLQKTRAELTALNRSLIEKPPNSKAKKAVLKYS